MSPFLSPRPQQAEKTKMSVPAFVVFCVLLAGLAAGLFLVRPANAAEPETSDPADITRDAAASLEAAKAELVRDLEGLTVKEAEFTAMIDETIGSCRGVRVEYIEASAGKSRAEGAIRVLEDVSRDAQVAERVESQLEEARLLATVHETEMGEIISRAENLDEEQEDLDLRRSDVRGKIAEIKSAIVTLDEAIAQLKPSSRDTRRTAGGIDWEAAFPLRVPEPYSAYASSETIEVPKQIAMCMAPGNKAHETARGEGLAPGVTPENLGEARPLLPGRHEGDL